MKKILTIMAVSIVTLATAVSCGSNPRNDTNNPAQDSLSTGQKSDPERPDNNVDNPRALTNGGDPAITQGAVLVANSDCKTCHDINKKMVGPSYNMIADKYSNTEAYRDELAYKIYKGGSGRWGQVAMPAHPQISIANANLMAGYVLSLKSK